MSVVIIVGSSRNDGDTKLLIDELIESTKWELIDLNNYNFSYFDYQHQNSDDDYIPLMKQVVQKYDTIIFATPVYWYAMSGIMKVFFDRFTDLLTIEKDLGRRLRGKYMAAISCSRGGNLGDHFWLPFKETANYLGMEYLGNMHALVGEKHRTEIDHFIELINKGTSGTKQYEKPSNFSSTFIDELQTSWTINTSM